MDEFMDEFMDERTRRESVPSFSGKLPFADGFESWATRPRQGGSGRADP
jgi:hypothetical protein